MQREFAGGVRFRPGVRASGATRVGAGAECLIDDGFDSARAATAFGAAAEAAVDLLGIARKVFGGVDGVADIVVAEHVAGTNNHEKQRPFGDALPSIFKTAVRGKRKNAIFK